MRLGKSDRSAIKALSAKAQRLFATLQEYEQGDSVAVPELCRALEAGPIFVSFSCLTGDGEAEELDPSLGPVFIGRKKKRMSEMLDALRSNGYHGALRVIIDDCEPCRMWLWEAEQESVTTWCRLVMDDGENLVPEHWEIELWSDIEKSSGTTFADAFAKIDGNPRYELLVHKNLQHILRFPNKKRVGDGRISTVRKVAQYALQGLVLEKLFPNAILLQFETPWSVKDPLYDSLRQTRLPITHPFPDERR